MIESGIAMIIIGSLGLGYKLSTKIKLTFNKKAKG